MSVTHDMVADPIVVYLDTQDYIRLFNDGDGSVSHSVLQQLLEYRDLGKILIGFSWVTLLEFITKPTPEHREERVRRGQLIKDICGPNAFPFYGDFKHGARFPNEGRWISGAKGKLISASEFRAKMERSYVKMISEKPGLNRKQRRNLKRPQAMKQLLNDNTSSWGTKREHFHNFPVSDEVINSGVIPRFIKGKCSDAQFEQVLNKWFSDPAEFSRIAYDYANKPNLLNEFFGPSLSNMERSFENFQSEMRKLEGVKSNLLKHREELIDLGMDRKLAKSRTKLPNWKPFDFSSVADRLSAELGKERAEHFSHYLEKVAKRGYDFKKSDFFDLLQMCYVTDCDLFRCDKAMASLFQDYAPFGGKLVKKFSELPSKIDKILEARAN